MIETTIKWHKTSEELPEKSCHVLALRKNGSLYLINYSHKHKAFNAHDELEDTDYCFNADEIECWVNESEIINQIKSVSDRQNAFNYQSVVTLFNSICVSLPKIQKLTEARKKRIKAVAMQFEKDNYKNTFSELFKRIENSDFLTGRSGVWTGCNFDWILKPSNLIKIIEGNYDNKTAKPEKQLRQARMAEKPSYDIEELKKRNFLDDLEGGYNDI